MRTLGTPQVPQAQSLVDIALWDMAAKAAGLPLYQMLGGRKSKILVVCQHAPAPLQRGLYRLCRGAAARGVQGDQVPLLVQRRRSTSPMCEAVHKRFAGQRALTSCSMRSSATTWRAALHGGAAAGRDGIPLVRGAAARHRHRGLPAAAAQLARCRSSRPATPGSTCR